MARRKAAARPERVPSGDVGRRGETRNMVRTAVQDPPRTPISEGLGSRWLGVTVASWRGRCLRPGYLRSRGPEVQRRPAPERR
jgi:hypothetical protein